MSNAVTTGLSGNIGGMTTKDILDPSRPTIKPQLMTDSPMEKGQPME